MKILIEEKQDMIKHYADKIRKSFPHFKTGKSVLVIFHPVSKGDFKTSCSEHAHWHDGPYIIMSRQFPTSILSKENLASLSQILSVLHEPDAKIVAPKRLRRP
ncbi:hypothetical protein CDAR_65031 [Caerostris darwini]|uniref:Uncharacterized protein n=1 Tax=Caerostris darwini TaxID=1538125 RepID=A0AAV4VQ72_9ARAC|nr:hypothetical protein CDAR_65031 [Caerostris darwini]